MLLLRYIIIDNLDNAVFSFYRYNSDLDIIYRKYYSTLLLHHCAGYWIGVCLCVNIIVILNNLYCVGLITDCLCVR